MLQQRSLNILKILMGSQNITIEGLQSKTNLSPRQINYDIDLLNNWLENNRYSKIIKRPGGSFRFENNINDVLEDLSKGNINYILNEKERQKMIFLYIFLNYEMISLYHFMNLLEVSRGTISEDLNKLEKKLHKYNLKIKYSRSKGYQLRGKEEDIQYVMALIIVEIISFEEGNYIFQAVLKNKDFELVQKIKLQLVDSINNNKMNFTTNNLIIISYIYIFNVIRGNIIDITPKHELAATIEDVVEYQVARETLNTHKTTNHNQVKFLTTLLLSYSTGQEKIQTNEYFIIKDTIKNILARLKKTYAVNLSDNKVFGQLYSHIRPALFRMVFNYPMVNPIKKEIISQYQSIYIIIKELFESLGLNTQRSISEDELAYLTIHLVTFLSKDGDKQKKNITGIIVCPNGIGISVLLYQELSDLFPAINFLDTVSVNEFSNVVNNVDVVFSTTLIETIKPLFLVNPVMNNIEKATLVNNFNRKFGNLNVKENINIKAFINRIEKYVDIKDEKGLIDEVSYFFSNNLNLNIKRRQPMLSELIDEELIQLNVPATDWKDVIRKSAAPLVDTNKITNNYVDAMIKNTEESGPYIVITKNVALPHARPEEGALEVALGVTTLKDPIEFGNEKNDPVKYVFCLSAIDNTTHLKALSELVDLLGDIKFYEVMDNANTSEHIIDYIKENYKGKIDN